jgi:hypothetical protein
MGSIIVALGFLKHHMVKHAWHFDDALAQVTKVFSVDPCICNSAEQQMHYHNHGCALATIVSILNKEHRGSLVEIEGTAKVPKEEMKRNAQEEEMQSGKKGKHQIN